MKTVNPIKKLDLKLEKEIINFKTSSDYLKQEVKMIGLIDEMIQAKKEHEKKKEEYDNKDYITEFSNEEIKRIKQIINF